MAWIVEREATTATRGKGSAAESDDGCTLWYLSLVYVWHGCPASRPAGRPALPQRPVHVEYPRPTISEDSQVTYPTGVCPKRNPYMPDTLHTFI